MSDRHDVGARALRLVLARLTDDDWQASDATLDEFDDRPEQLRPAIQFLAGIAASFLVAARGLNSAIEDITDLIAEQLDAHNRGEHR
jgi:hypothetical protein